MLADPIGTVCLRVIFFMNRFRKLGFTHYNGGLQVHSSRLNVVLHAYLAGIPLFQNCAIWNRFPHWHGCKLLFTELRGPRRVGSFALNDGAPVKAAPFFFGLCGATDAPFIPPVGPHRKGSWPTFVESTTSGIV